MGVLSQNVFMNWVLVLAIALSFLTGVSLTYSLLKQQVNKQKESQTAQIQKTIERLEKAHESRMQTTINSLRQHYDSQLNQATELLQKEFEVKALNLQQTLEENARVKALKDFQSEKDRFEKTFEEKYRLELIKWKTLYEKSNLYCHACRPADLGLGGYELPRGTRKSL